MSKIIVPSDVSILVLHTSNMIKGKSKASSTKRTRLPHNMCAIAHHELAKKARDFVKTITGTLLKMEKYSSGISS